jgi:hypothetical protein
MQTYNCCLLQSFQAERVTDGAWGSDWIGTPVPFQRCLLFVIARANKEFTLTAGKFVPVCNSTMMNVRLLIVGKFMRMYTVFESGSKTVTMEQI